MCDRSFWAFFLLPVFLSPPFQFSWPLTLDLACTSSRWPRPPGGSLPFWSSRLRPGRKMLWTDSAAVFVSKGVMDGRTSKLRSLLSLLYGVSTSPNVENQGRAFSTLAALPGGQKWISASPTHTHRRKSNGSTHASRKSSNWWFPSTHFHNRQQGRCRGAIRSAVLDIEAKGDKAPQSTTFK